ncbi:MAG: DUF1593 domain-containing protein [Firmicutes bacterium]|nr:DUF1593 domain-containing protein [Bacillota bacterium]
MNSVANPRPRVIVTTDGEIDDRCSMVRFLQYANEFEIEGIINSSSMFHWDGHDWEPPDWIERWIDRYEQVYDNLKQHADGYPAPQYLRNVTFVGNTYHVGEMGKETPGSNRIVEVLLDEKPGPVYLQAWGGTNTIARALKTIQEQYSLEIERVSKQAILYVILDQDRTLMEYIIPNWPTIQVLNSIQQFGCIAYAWKRSMPPDVAEYFRGPWMEKNILKGHGPLMALYEAYTENHTQRFADTTLAFEKNDFRSEGDSPAFMHQIDVGLRSLEHPSYGGWGGRFVQIYPFADTPFTNGPAPLYGNHWLNAWDDGDINKPIWRWAKAFQNDWASRADWCIMDFNEANHPPVVHLNHPEDLIVRPGMTVGLSGTASDPDNDSLSYRWWQYGDADTYHGTVDIRNANNKDAYFIVPKDVIPGDTIHIILEVTDSGTPPLTRYRRVIATVE